MLQVLAAEGKVGKGERVVRRPRDFRTLVQDTLNSASKSLPMTYKGGLSAIPRLLLSAKENRLCFSRREK